MSESDIWEPAPRITLNYSQYPPRSNDVLITYSTDTEKTDPEKAREQASILTEWHFEFIPRPHRTGRAKRTRLHCALINEQSILIRNLGIITTAEQGDDTRTQLLTLAAGREEDYLTGEMFWISRLIFEKRQSTGGKWEFQVRTQIDFDKFRAAVDPRYEGQARISGGVRAIEGRRARAIRCLRIWFKGLNNSNTWLRTRSNLE